MEGAVVRFRLITLDEITFRRGEITKVALHPTMLIFYAAFICVLILLDANGTRGKMPVLAHVAAYVAGAVAAIAFIVASLRIGEATARATGRDALINGSLVCFGGSLSAMLVGEAVTTLLLGRGTLDFIEGLILAVFYYGMTELVMVFLTAYILPHVQDRVRAESGTPAAAEPAPVPVPAAPAAPANLVVVPDGGVVAVLPKRAIDVVRVGAARFALADIRRVEAEGNYVRIITAAGRSLLPGPFSQVVRQLPDTDGQVISRSCWVAASGIVAHRRQGRDLFLLLEDGTEAKVAAGRREAVTAWLRSIEQARTLQAG